jgi:Protein of unknown function (DUF2723)
MVSYFWGVAHPPGYPLYTILCHLFTMLPFDTVPYRVCVFDALMGSLGILFSFLIFNKVFKHLGIALAGALLLSVCSTVWNQNIIAKLYSMNFLLCVWVYYICLLIREKPFDKSTTKKFLYLGVVAGLSLANHWPIFLLNSPGYFCFVRKDWFKKNYVLIFLAGLCVAFIPYLMMLYRSQADPTVAFLGPIKDVSDLWSYVARNYYSITDASVLHTWHDTFSFFVNFLRSFWLRDYIFLTVPLALAGVYRLFKTEDRRLALSVIPMFLSTTFTLLFLLKYEYNDLDENIQRVYWLVPFFAYAFWVTAGASWVEARKKYAGLALLMLCVLTQLFMYYHKNNLSHDDFAEAYARTVLSHVPAGEKLIVSTDADVGPVGVTNLILGVNPTVQLYTGSGVFFKNRIFDPHIMGYNQRQQLIIDFIKSVGRVYTVKSIEVLDEYKNIPLQIVFDGLVYRYSATTEPDLKISPETLDLAKKALDSYVRSADVDNWFYHRQVLASRLCNLLVLQGIEDHPAFSISPDCIQVLSRHYANTGRRQQADDLFLKWWAMKRNPIVTEKQQYLYYFLINRLELVNSLVGQRDRQIALLQSGIEIAATSLYDFPLCENKIAPLIKSISGPIMLSPDIQERLKFFDHCASPQAAN